MSEFVVDPLSLPSLHLEVLAKENVISRATGFVVVHEAVAYLITNLHVVRGRDTESEDLLSSTGAEPDALRIFHHSALAADAAGVWCFAEEALYDEGGEPRWLRHPNYCIKDSEHPREYNVDIAALPLADVDEERVRLHPVDLSWAQTDVHVAPGLPVFIIGYPFGRFGAALFPIWKTGHVASDPDAHWSQRYFLVDATTRIGMSGSPVIYRSPGIYQRTDGATTVGRVNRLLGIYSGRIQETAEIGIVWRPHLITETITQAVQSDAADQ